jgi:hypothetical protein
VLRNVLAPELVQNGRRKPRERVGRVGLGAAAYVVVVRRRVHAAAARAV